MERYSHWQPTRLHFGAGAFQECGRIARRYGNRCLLVTAANGEAAMSPLYDRAQSILEDSEVETVLFDGVIPNPTTDVVDSGIEQARLFGIDMVVAVGGGSSIDTAKAISIFSGLLRVDWRHWFSALTNPFEEQTLLSTKALPLIAVTTTSGTGSQMTQAMVISEPKASEKNCIFDPAAFPREAIVDPELMLTLPPRMTAITGFDAFSHAFESYLSGRASALTMLLAEEAIRTIASALPAVIAAPQNVELRAKMAWADTLAGISLANAGAGIPHPLSEIVGGVRPDLAHGQCLAALYPAHLARIAANGGVKAARLARILGEATGTARAIEDPRSLVDTVSAFLERIGLNRRLSALSCTQEQLSLMEKSPVLDALPWAPKADLVAVLRASF